MVKIIRYKGYSIKKYNQYKKCPFETYKPKRKIEIRRDQTLPFLFRFGNFFLNLGGIIGLGVYGFLNGLKEFLGFKNRIQTKIRSKGKVIEFKLNK